MEGVFFSGGVELNCSKANFIFNSLFVYMGRACLMSLELEPQIAVGGGTHPLDSRKEVRILNPRTIISLALGI